MTEVQKHEYRHRCYTIQNAIHDINRESKPTLHNRFDCSVDPDMWRKAIEDIKNNKQG
jgi:hypothetical protein